MCPSFSVSIFLSLSPLRLPRSLSKRKLSSFLLFARTPASVMGPDYNVSMRRDRSAALALPPASVNLGTKSTMRAGRATSVSSRCRTRPATCPPGHLFLFFVYFLLFHGFPRLHGVVGHSQKRRMTPDICRVESFRSAAAFNAGNQKAGQGGCNLLQRLQPSTFIQRARVIFVSKGGLG